MSAPGTLQPPTARTRQAGVGLVELLVALVIGMLVSIAAIGTLSHARLSAGLLGEVTRLYQDADIALRIIEQQVRPAGGRRLLNVGGGAQVAFGAGPVASDATALPRAVDGQQGAAGKPDTLRTATDADAAVDARDCLGNPPTGDRVQSAFELVAGNLRCKGSGQANPAPLVEGVEDFQVRYAVRVADDSLQYQETPTDWGQVQGVWVCLRLASPLRTAGRGASLTGCQDETVPADGRIRRVFMRVIHLRNASA
ncbi:PilW family protein [Hydrogenophaga sp.]|uniref:PilW family protein n=1 Tax=Hydrogenophaga sp. TaxID=1904254 RepID=UPI00262139EF|nr:PilW family protein [Hydrogenophaga sp.]MCW5654097.1 PilW family protein [Hydrogenophaga sp.]